ncbi:hypothetical protein ACFVVM_16340 [Nocardia sp. NPDC058176]|uniref:hypothetical protein n=1 Tax=Nocardia sp. NPDC058176 TaxID=3346368 RepID=UPI0036DD51D0
MITHQQTLTSGFCWNVLVKSRLVPAPRANGGSLNELAHQWSGGIGLDAEFESAVAVIEELASADDDSDPSQS